MTKANADFYERGMIERLGTMAPNGYNLTAGGEGMTGYRYSAASRAKMAAAKIGLKLSTEHVEKTKNALRLYYLDPKNKAQYTARMSNPAIRARMSSSAKARGSCLSEQGLKKISDLSKKAWANPEFRRRMSAHLSDPDMIRRRNAAIKAAHSTPEARAASSVRQKARMADPEFRRKAILNLKLRWEKNHAYAT